MSTKDDLQFMDSGQDDDVLFDKTDSHTITFTNFPDSAVDDEDETEDKSQLLKDDKKAAPSFWTFEYYQQFFDVETHQVFQRVVGSMLPLPKRDYLQSQIRPSPDLYGPFWICTTLVFTTAIAGNLANYLASGGKDYQWKYDFHKVTFAATAIFSYWWLIPTLIYGMLWWKKSQAGYTFLEIICVYGYSLAIYIPISILWVVNITWFKWVLVVVGAVMSGGVLVITFWPALKDEERKFAVIVTAMIFIFHLALAAGFVLYFFHAPVTTAPIIYTTAPPFTTKALMLPEKGNQPSPARLKQGANDLQAKPKEQSMGNLKGVTKAKDKVNNDESGVAQTPTKEYFKAVENVKQLETDLPHIGDNGITDTKNDNTEKVKRSKKNNREATRNV